MVVSVAAAVTFFLHELRRRVQNMFRRQQRAGLLGSSHSCAERGIAGIRLRRGRTIDHRLCNRELAFRGAQEVERIFCSICDDERLRICQADILYCHAHDTPRDIKRRFARIKHATQIVERGIRV